MRHVSAALCKQLIHSKHSGCNHHFACHLVQVRLVSNLPAPEKETAVTAHPEPKAISQALIKRVPVEYHGIAAHNFNDETQWLPIYRFPFISPFRAFIRFKVYLTFTSVAVSFLKIYQHLFTTSTALPGALALSSVTLIGMIYLGNIARRMVVQIYSSQDTQCLRFCRFTFYGKRLDMVIPTVQVTPLSENNVTANKSFLKVRVNRPKEIDLSYDTYEFYDEPLKLMLRYGGILDKERFKYVFGDIISRKQYR